MVGGRRDEGQGVALGQLRGARHALVGRGEAGDRVEPFRREALRAQLALAGRGREASFGERHERAGNAEAHRALALEALEGDALHVGVVPVEGLSGHLLVAVAEARVVEAHAGRETPEELGVRPGLTLGRDRRPVEAHVQVTIGLVDVVVLEGGGGRQHDVREVDGVGPEELVHHGEEILAGQTRADALLIRRHRRHVGVVDEQRLHWRVESLVGEDPSDLAHVEGAGAGRGEVGALEGGGPHRVGTGGRQERPAAGVAPGADHRRKAGDGPDRHAAARRGG